MSNAPALLKLRAQINQRCPNRNKLNDGLIGDDKHKNRKSDHNENAAGVVTALDITHDPRHGVDTYAFADYMRKHPDKRVAFIISNRRIWTQAISPNWRAYTKSNPHTMHVHISVRQSPKFWDDASDWDIGDLGKADANAPAVVEVPLLKIGSQGEQVKELQKLLHIAVDGGFGPLTEAAVKAFQREHKLPDDGVVGPYTWAALREAPPTQAAFPPTTAVPGLDITSIVRIAGDHPIARFNWPGRGPAPLGYTKGVALSFANMALKLKAGDPLAVACAVKAEDGNDNDALRWYRLRMGCFGLVGEQAGIDTLRYLFVLMLGLGMRESNGKHCEGRDMKAKNVSAESAEAGVWQTSWDIHDNVPMVVDLMQSSTGNGFLPIYSEGVHCTTTSWKNWGTGRGVKFQELSKSTPDFAAQATAIGLRQHRKHWGPINRREVTIRIEADDMLRKVQELVWPSLTS